jgi:transposase
MFSSYLFLFKIMFIKKIDKSNRKNGKDYFTYRLCESYRIGGKVRHRGILNLGKLENISREQHKLLCDRLEQKLNGVNMLFSNIPANIEKEAKYFYRRILHEKVLDCKAVAPVKTVDTYTPDIQSVDINSIVNEDSRTMGGEWLSKQMADGCGLSSLLLKLSGNGKMSKQMLAEIICRMVHPSSDLEMSRRLEAESALCELFGLTKTPSHKDLYAASRELYEHKDEIERFLFEHFASKYPDELQVRLFDLTNFYFEGRQETSELAQFGRSKEKRSDAKLVSLAMLTNGHGFCCRSKLYAGNISEPKTLKEVIDDLEKSSLQSPSLFAGKPVAVMDAGIATKENLLYLRSKKIDYICVSRSSLNAYSALSTSPLIITDNRDNPIEIQVVKDEEDPDGDLYLYVKSSQKRVKEESMSKKITARFIQDLENIKDSLSKKRGVKEEDMVNRRIGRLIEKYPKVSQHYKIELQTTKKKIVTDITWLKEKEPKAFGVYFIRCSQKQLTDKLIWKIYNTLRDIESTFRCLKTDLDIHPIYHQKDINTQAHIFAGIVAFQLVNAIRQSLKEKWNNHDWRHIRNIMSSQTMITTRMKLANEDCLFIRQPSRANRHAAEIYNALGFKQSDKTMRKKSVVPH